MLEELKPDETELIGSWVNVDGEVDGDENCQRIQFLINEKLERVGKDWSGWEALFRDPSDGRYWLRTYPNGSWHGGGPPALICLTMDEARKKYPQLF